MQQGVLERMLGQKQNMHGKTGETPSEVYNLVNSVVPMLISQF